MRILKVNPKMCVLLGALLLTEGLFAQSNEFIDQVIVTPSLRADEAAYLVLTASDNLSDDADPQRSFEFLQELGWAPGLAADTRITYGQFASVLMNAFGIPGTLLYQLFPTPRYAYRDLCQLVVIQGATDPDMPVSGAAALRMIGRVFDVQGVEE